MESSFEISPRVRSKFCEIFGASRLASVIFMERCLCVSAQEEVLWYRAIVESQRSININIESILSGMTSCATNVSSIRYQSVTTSYTCRPPAILVWLFAS
jgi:hypothetical protein